MPDPTSHNLPFLAQTYNRWGKALLGHIAASIFFLPFTMILDDLSVGSSAVTVILGALLLYLFVLSFVFNLISVIDYTHAFTMPRSAQLFCRLACFCPILSVLVAATLRAHAASVLRGAGVHVTFKGIRPEDVAMLTHNVCEHCGYSRDGITANAPCPECGLAAPSA